MNFVDPFQSDTDKFKRLLEKDSINSRRSESAEYIECEEVPKSTEELLDRSTVNGLPPSIFKAAQEAQKKLNLDKEKREQVAQAFNSLFDDLNKKYGLNVRMDFDSFNNTLGYIIEPTNKRAMEYYLSEAYGRFRVAIYSMYLQSIAMLSAQILNPAYILSESMTYGEKLDTMAKLYEFLHQIEEIYEKVNIPDTEVKLEKLTSDQRPTYDLKDPKIRDYMEAVFGQVTKSNQIESKDE